MCLRCLARSGLSDHADWWSCLPIVSVATGDDDDDDDDGDDDDGGDYQWTQVLDITAITTTTAD